MLWPILSCVSLFLLTYMLTIFSAKYFSAWNTTDTTYLIKHDPFIYIFFTTLVGTFLIYWFTPDLSDSVSPLSNLQTVLPFLASALLYICYLLADSNRRIYTFLCIFFGALICSSSINLQASPLNDTIPIPFQIIGIALFITCVTLSSKLLIGLPSIFSLFIVTGLLGITLLSFLGGLPFLFALFACFSLGIWFAVYQNNRFQKNILLNDYALMSTTLLICTLFAHAISEFSGPSVLILTFYPLSELLCALFTAYILNQKEQDLYLNTAYIHAYRQGASISVLQTLLLKISILNIALASFQLYSVNSFTLPLVGLLLNLWLLSKLYASDVPPLTTEDSKESKGIQQNDEKD